MAAKSPKRVSETSLNQLSLFGAPAIPQTPSPAPTPLPTPLSAPTAIAPNKPKAAEPIQKPAKRASLAEVRRGKREILGRILSVKDMPDYPVEAREAADMSLRALPRDQLWFTYKDVKYFFGVSRATVARRLRERLVPGILMDGDHVVEDSAIRRFDRDQLRWLLLAVRHRPRQSTLQR